jgi:hypothetical protein
MTNDHLSSPLAILSTEVMNQTRQHLANHLVSFRMLLAFGGIDVFLFSGNSEVSPHLVARSSCAVQVRREVPIRLLTKSFADEWADATR